MKSEKLSLCLLTKDENEKRVLQKAAEPLSEKVTLKVYADPSQLLSSASLPEETRLVIIDADSLSANGKDCVRKIRSDDRFAQTTIIVLISYKSKGLIKYFLSNGADLFINRPTSCKRGFTVLKRILCCKWSTNILSSSWEVKYV